MLKVIGIGSPFGDDSLGWQIINGLKAVVDICNHDVQLITADRPALRLIELMQEANEVILIDAIKCQREIGELVNFSVADILSSQSLLSSHDFGVQQAVQLAQALEQLPPKLSFYGIVIGNLDYYEHISSTIQASIDKLVNELAVTIALRRKCEKNQHK